MRIRRIAAFGLLALAALALATLAVAVIADSGSGTPQPTTAAPLHPVAGNFKPDATTLEDCSDDVQACIEQAYGNIAYDSGPKRALAVLEEKIDSASNSCHRIAHSIGSASLARYQGNVGRTFAEGFSACFSGYYHGVLERSLVNVKSYKASALGAVARGLCTDSEIRAIQELEYHCLHGLGHGLMITSGYSLPLSLDVCDYMQGVWAARACNGGVFMENFFTSYGVQSPWVRADDPVYPCNWVAEEDKRPCYQLVTSRILRVVGVDWERTAEICGSIEREWISSCFESYGRDASGQTHRDAEEILGICASARPYGGERQCVQFAAMDHVENYAAGTQAAAFCDKTSLELQAPCYQALGTILGRFKRTPEERAVDCRSLTNDRSKATACIRGASTQLDAVVGQ
ncbi:MAG: hypothetical protein H0V58_04510 [Actinobacteria bacterium]|nr:hypothetical protein [Actinomycetota bacterium]